MTRLVAVLGLLCGCGRIGFSPLDDGRPDAALDPHTPFGPPVLLADLSSPMSDDDPTLTGDLLEIIWDSERTGASAGGDLFVARRADLTAPWSSPERIVELATSGDEDTPCLSLDGLTLTFASDRNTPGRNHLFFTTRPDRGSPWAAPTSIAELDGATEEQKLCFTDDQLVGVFHGDLAGGTGVDDLWQTRRSSVQQAWGPPAELTALDTVLVERDPMLSADGTVIVFDSLRTGNGDLYLATRADLDATFEAPAILEPFSTSLEESDPWLSPDGHTLVFTRGSAGGRDLYMATR